MAPIYGLVYNWDLLDDEFLRPGVLTAVNSKQVAISKIMNLVDYSDPMSVADFESLTDWMEGFLGENNGADEPFSDFYYPILKQSRETIVASSKSFLVGLIIVTRPWHYLIRNILPEGSSGIHVVIGNDCNQSFTYEIDGPRVIFLGNGDRHEVEYDSMMVRLRCIFKI